MVEEKAALATKFLELVFVCCFALHSFGSVCTWAWFILALTVCIFLRTELRGSVFRTK